MGNHYLHFEVHLEEEEELELMRLEYVVDVNVVDVNVVEMIIEQEGVVESMIIEQEGVEGVGAGEVGLHPEMAVVVVVVVVWYW